jgi:flavin-dependent dehydrogenase
MSIFKSRTISIAGAGPAGLIAAINLARAGSDVIVHEQHPDVGMRFSEDFQAIENWSSQEDLLTTFCRIGIKPTFYCRPIHKVSSYGPRSSTHVNFEQPIAYMVQRGCTKDTLDSSLKRQALESGVHLRFGSCLTETEADIIAMGPRRARTLAVGIIFETDLEECVALLLDDNLAPKGYAYVLVAEGRGTLCTVLYEKFNLGKGCLEATISRFKDLLGMQIRNARYFGGHGDFDLTRSLIVEHRRYVGEAAGFQDYLFGFGIRYAMLSGYLAAKSIIEGSSYDKLCRDSFRSWLRTSLVNRYCYKFLGQSGYDMLVRASGRACDPKQFWTRMYTRPFFRMVAYPFALRSISLVRNR